MIAPSNLEEIQLQLLRAGWAVAFRPVEANSGPGHFFCSVHRRGAVFLCRDWETGHHGSTMREALIGAMRKVRELAQSEAYAAGETVRSREKDLVRVTDLCDLLGVP